MFAPNGRQEQERVTTYINKTNRLLYPQHDVDPLINLGLAPLVSSLLAWEKWVKRSSSSSNKSSKSWIAITAAMSRLASEAFNLALALFSYSSVGASHELGLSCDGSPQPFFSPGF